ncbi:MarR family transcriptional regulator [Streptomyces sp. NPDC001404]|uniref:MarR family transcriptional regulator n=1 Tax=Streptomyces sp. NPDC001404 TaxID=3364571 RepID=UPI003697296F
MSKKQAETEVWGYAKVEEVTGIKVGTLRRYKKEGHMPAPDITVGNSPGWYPQTIQEWKKNRPGRGFRSDLKDQDA